MAALKLFVILFVLMSHFFGDHPAYANYFKIVDIRSHVNTDTIAFKTLVHDNNTKFDIYMNLFKPLKTHDLLMSLKLKRKIDGSSKYQTIIQLRRIDVCKFVANNQQKFLMQTVFKLSAHVMSQLMCPMKVGDYNITNLLVATSNFVNSLEPGNYGFYVEVAQLSGLSVKLLNMQINLRCHK
ncbi:uncharacterized protein LOC128871823 [Anastrepha ludens]|uniref:uncharacterized protein LOC128871823 n=1 Tax=Anastrepha ludens TaxID=28586 RepID=UPI0023AF4DBE|nr:uncharacterized protein LOC128871823 [Anastrepha ludens]